MHPDLALTGQIPDIVIHDKRSSPHKIIMLELTCPRDMSAKNAEVRKRYERLALDLEEAGVGGAQHAPRGGGQGSRS